MGAKIAETPSTVAATVTVRMLVDTHSHAGNPCAIDQLIELSPDMAKWLSELTPPVIALVNQPNFKE